MEETQQLEECILEEDQLEAHSSDKSEPLARLRVFKNDYFPETEFPLYLGDNILGRDPSVCSPALNARSVSKQHAVISVSFLPGHQLADDPVTEALLWDLGSMNGTRKARFRLTPHVRYALVEGESVLLADLPCQYVSGQNVAKRESEGEASRASGEAGAKNSSPTPNITPCKGLSLGHTPSQPEKPLVSESESDDEKETRRKGAGMVPDLDLSAPTCSTFLSSSSNIVPESEDEISITPSHPGNNSSHHVLSKMQAKTLPRCQRAGLKMVLHDSDSEVEESILEESTDLDVEKKSGGNLGTVASLEESNKSIRTVSGAILDAHSPDEGHKRQPGCGSGGTDAVENRSSSVEGVPEEVNLEKLELTRDSETDAEAEDEIKEEGRTSPLSGNLYHLDSDTDVEEEDLPAPVCGAPADSTKATHRSQGEDEFHLGSDTGVEEEDGVGCSFNAGGGAVAGDKLFLDSDTDVEDNELISSALAPTKLLSDHARCLNRSKEVNQEPQLPKNDLPKPQELDMVSDTDTEDVSPGSVESKECQGLDNPFTTTKVVPGLEIKSDSESDAEVESTQMFASAAQVVPLAVGGPDETVKGQVAVGPGAFNTDSDTDVEGEDESSHAAHKRLQQINVTLQKCSTPKSSGVSEEETQAFVSAAEPFRCPFLPSIMKTKPCTEDEDEEFIVAETQSFVSDPPPENTDAKDAPLDATQLYTSNSPQGEQDEPTQNFSFQLGLSDSSSAQSGKPKCIGGFHPIQEEEDDDLSATQAYVPISTSLTGFDMQIGSDMEATQAYHIGMRRTEVNVESDLYSTNAAEISKKCSRQMDFLADLSTADTEPVSILGVGLVEETKEGKREVTDTKTYSDIRHNENESIKSSISAKRGSVSADYTEEPIVQPVRRSIRGRSKAETNGKGQHKDKEKKDDETKEVKREEIGKRRGRRASKNQKGEMERLREEKIEDTELLDREESEQLGREKEDNEGLEKEEKELEKEESELLKRDENDRCIREKREKEERERFEREKKEREEMEQLEREKREKEEMERLERENREREEMERLERENREREEKERLEREKEREEKERLEREKEREEKELLEREKRERENEWLGREENERLEREKREREENERLEREKRERDENERLEREKEREEKKRLEREEKERFEREKREREEKEMLEREKREREEKERFEREKKEREEKEMLERENREREEKERFEREKKEREEKEMLEREKRERDESERLEREKEREEKKRLEREEKERFEREKREREEKELLESECNERLQREENERQEKHKSERKDLDLKSLKIEKLEQEQHLEGKEKETQSKRPSRSRRPTKGGPGLCHTTAAGNAEPSGQDFTAGIAAGRGRTRSSSISSEKSTSCSGTQKQGSSRRSQRTSPQNPDSDQCALNKDLPAIKLSGRQKKRGIVTSTVEAEVPSTQAQGKVFSNNNGARRSSRNFKPENLDTTPPENIPSQEIILPNLSSKGRNGIKKCTNSELLRPNEDKSSSPPEHLSVQEEIGCNISNGRKRNLEDESEQGEDGSNFKMPKNRRKSQKVPNVTEMDTSEENKNTHQRLVTQRKGRASTVLTKKKKQEEEVKNERDKKDEAGSGSVERKVRGRRAVLQTTGSKKAEEQMEKSNNLPSPNSEDLESKDAVTEGPQTPSGRAPRKRGHPVNSPSAAKTPRRSTQTHLPKVLFTGVSDEAGEAVVPRLGGMMANGVTDMTHLVTDKVRRTVKFLCAVARGVPIVTTAWLNKCGKSGSFVTPDAFLVKDAEQEKKFGFCLKESLQAACSKPLLQDYEVHVTRSVKPEPAQMKDIITCSGARYLPKMPTVHKPLLVVISCMEDASLCRPALSASVPVVSAEFLLTGILQQKIDLDAHRLAGADFKNVVKAASKGKKK